MTYRSLFRSVLPLVLLLGACSPAPQPELLTPTAAASALAQSPTPARAESPSPTPPEPVTDRLAELLAYLPQEWAESHQPAAFGPPVVFLDFAAQRTLLSLPPVTGADPRAMKLDLLAGLETQGLDFVPEPLDPAAASFYDQWAWDLADVQATLYLPDIQTAALLGDFSRPEVAVSLTEQGFLSAPGEAGFTQYSKPGEALVFALRPDRLLVSSATPAADYLTALIRLAESGAGMSEHPLIQDLQPELEGAAGAVLAPRPDLEALEEQTQALLAELGPDSELAELLQEGLTAAGELHNPDWDFMALVFFPSVDGAAPLSLQYHFPFPSQAEGALELARRALTESTSLGSPGLTWADLWELETVEAGGEWLVARGTTRDPNLLGESIRTDDLNALLLLPPPGWVATPTPTGAPTRTPAPSPTATPVGVGIGWAAPF